MLSEPLHTKPNCLSITAYTDNQSLYDAVHSMKQTLEKHLVVDIHFYTLIYISLPYKKWLKEMRSESHGLTKKNK